MTTDSTRTLGLQDLFSGFSDAVIVADLQRRMTYVNHAAEELFGYPGDQLLGRTTAMLYQQSDDYDEQGMKRYNPAAGPGTSRYLVRYRRSDGFAFFGHTTGGPIRGSDGQPTGYVGIIRPASAPEQAVDMLHRVQAVASDASSTWSERIDRLLALCAGWFDLPLAIQSRVDGDIYTVEHCVDPDGQLQPGTTFPLGQTYCVHTLRAGGPTGFHHAAQSVLRDHPCYRAFGLEAYLGCPIYVDDKPYGTLNFTRPAPTRPFTDDDLALMQLLAHWVGHAIESARHRKELERLATQDPLTGALNRRAMLEKLGGLRAQAQRAGHPVSVLLFDLDRFKAINDNFGHSAGDAVLIDVAAKVQACCREADLLARFGGEEFIVALADTDREDAVACGERLLQTLASIRLPDVPDLPTVTASVGVATWREGETIDGLLKRADAAMYRAKDAGRARVVAAG